jgi:hypothetical protein
MPVADRNSARDAPCIKAATKKKKKPRSLILNKISMFQINRVWFPCIARLLSTTAFDHFR